MRRGRLPGGDDGFRRTRCEAPSGDQGARELWPQMLDRDWRLTMRDLLGALDARLDDVEVGPCPGDRAHSPRSRRLRADCYPTSIPTCRSARCAHQILKRKFFLSFQQSVQANLKRLAVESRFSLPKIPGLSPVRRSRSMVVSTWCDVTHANYLWRPEHRAEGTVDLGVRR